MECFARLLGFVITVNGKAVLRGGGGVLLLRQQAVIVVVDVRGSMANSGGYH